jgi:molecular chaperone DnaK (HSP70)
MPLPFIIGGLAAIAGIGGAVSGVKGAVELHDASTTMSQRIYEEGIYDGKHKDKQEEFDIRIQAEAMVYKTEKTIAEIKDKVAPNILFDISTAHDALKYALHGEDINDIKIKCETLNNKLQHVLQQISQLMELRSTLGLD